MPLLSAFTPCGMLSFSSKPSHLETIYYKSMWSGLGGNYAQGGVQDARIYAQARGLARVRYTLQRAGNQALPTKITDMLPRKESEYGLVPGPQDDVVARRRALATRYLLPAGAMLSNLTTALRTLLGSDFVSVTPNTSGTVTPWVIYSTSQNWQLPTIPRKLLRLIDPITSPGSQEFHYTLADPFGAGLATGALPDFSEQQLNAQDVVIIEPDQGSKYERVTITAQGDTFLYVTGLGGKATATFAKPHPAGVLLTNQPWPYWWTTSRYILVQVTANAALNADTRRKIHELMARFARGVDQWAVVISNGPFVLAATQSNPVDTSKGVLNATPLT